MRDCSISECEKGSSVVYCPNRFTFNEMLNVKMALHMAPGMIEDFMESVEDYKSLNKEGKAMYDNGEKLIKEMTKLEKKVDGLLDLPIE